MPKILPEKIHVKFNKRYGLRSFVVEEAKKLQDFFCQSALESQHTLQYQGGNIPINKLQERIKQALEATHDLFIGVFDDENIIAQLFFRVPYPDHPWAKHVGEFGMTVLKDYWGQGIGTALLDKMEEFAKNCGIMRIEAKVRQKNERGLALYKKRGYEIEGIRKNVVLIDQVFEDECYIAKLFV